MNDLTPNTSPTMSSREIAELTGKEHRNVLRDVRAMTEDLGINCSNLSSEYTADNGQTYLEYHLDRELTDTLITGYSAKLRHAVIQRWHDLESGQATPLHQIEGSDLTDETRRLRHRLSVLETIQGLREQAKHHEEERERIREAEESMAALLSEDASNGHRYRLSSNPGRIEVVPEGADVSRGRKS